MFEAGAVVIVVLRKMVGLRKCFGEALRSIPPIKKINKMHFACQNRIQDQMEKYIYIVLWWSAIYEGFLGICISENNKNLASDWLFVLVLKYFVC